MLLLVLLGFGISANASAADRYKWITSNDEVTILYDVQSIRFDSTYGKTVDVWYLWQYNDEGARNKVERLRKKGVCQENKWDNFSYILEHDILNSNNQYKTLECVYYDAQGNVLHSLKNTYPEWQSVVPGSLGELTYNAFAVFLKGK